MADISKYVKKQKHAPHEKAAIVDLFLDFVGGETEQYNYGYWLRKIGTCTYGDAIDILKSLESLPIIYSRGGTLINKLNKLNGREIKKVSQ